MHIQNMASVVRSNCLLVLCGTIISSTYAYGPKWHELEGYSFDRYAADFQKYYTTQAEHVQRRHIFEAKINEIRNHNNDPTKGWKMGVNHLSDQNESERRVRGVDKSLLHHQRHMLQESSAIDITGLPVSVDWRSRGVLTAVKNQGSCGSCWTFASAETVESHWALKTGHLEAMSEQFILDCVTNPYECGGSGGCFGGTAALAFEGLAARGGAPSEWTYPYISGTGANQSCKAPAHIPLQHPHSGAIMLAANVTGHVSVATNSYEGMMHALATVGPLTITVDAGGWHDYETGVFAGGNHTNPDLDHLVQLVGYGTEAGKDYWLVRNSWTPEWGQEGYIQVARTNPADAECGVDITPLDGDGCAAGPNKSPLEVKVCGVSGILYDGAYPIV